MKSLKSLFLKFCVALVIISLMTSCKKEYVSSGNTNKSNVRFDDDMKQFSQIIAKGMSNPEFRMFLKNEAIKQFDGDFDILLASNYEKRVEDHAKSDSQTIISFLHNQDLTNLKSATIDNSFLDSLIIKYPLLQISIPEIFNSSVENWDALNKELLVSFLPKDYNEKTTEYLIAFDSKGKLYKISAREEPKEPVIIVSLNERLNYASSDLKAAGKQVYFKNKHYTYYFPSGDQIPVAAANLSQLKSGTIATYDRDFKSGSDILFQGRFVSKDAYRQVEGWPAGRPEFTVIIAYVDKSSGSPNAGFLSKVLDESGWVRRYVFYSDLRTKELNVPILRWYRDRYGLDMKYHWIERDSGGDKQIDFTTTVTTKYDDNTSSTQTIKCSFDNNDDDAGEAIVQYEDNTDGDGTEYNTGIMRFWIKQ